MTKAEKTRQHIIEQTAPVFNQNGFAGTSLTALQNATGLTKGSLYGHFADKEAMAVAAFEYSMLKVRSLIMERMAGLVSPREKLDALFSFFGEYVFNPPIPGGCPLLNNGVEADDHHTSMKKTVSREIQKVTNFIAKLLEEGKRVNEFKKTFDSKELATICFSAIEGSIMISRVSSSDVAVKAVVKYCSGILDQISK
jgi:TetR/AcrR family transcriptional regulator, transcriptional repressor for nem operon